MIRNLLVTAWFCLAACGGRIDDPGQRGFDLPVTVSTGAAGAPAGAAPASAAGNGPVTLPAATLRRLTLSQYQNSLRDLLGVEADVSTLTAIPPLNGLRAVGASTVALPQRDLESFETLGEGVSAQVFSDASARMKLTGCDARESACAKQFIRSFGRRAFRRPLTADEQQRYDALLMHAIELSADAWLGLRVVTSAFLQSPAFLYREELGQPDPSDPSRRILTPFELTARLSFFLWNTAPDDALLDAAESGTLATANGLTTQAKRLLAAPRAIEAAGELISDYLGLDALDALVKLPEAYPQSSTTLPAAMKEETLRSVRAHLFERGDDFRDLFTSNKTFANAELAKLYGVRAPSPDSFAAVDLPANGPRAGLLMQASFLAIHAHPSRSSPTLRGKFIRENLLCQAIPPPPNNVDTSLPANTRDAMTARQRLTAHREDPSCAGCHTLMDPIGLALENFDGIGAFRERENNLTIDASGELDGKTFADARGLAAAIAADPNATSCFVRTLFRYARGALEQASEASRIAALDQAFGASGYRTTELMLAIVKDPAFRQVGALP
ncbi:MAG TPA: DUF1592 domain-containing protein [Polyangiales bacterium]|nr:DUF1592 domain-containing protein [Polyangiales bacterium]